MAPTTLTLPAGEHVIRLHNPELGREETLTVVIDPGEIESLRRKWK